MQNRKEYEIFYLALKLIHPERNNFISYKADLFEKKKKNLNLLILEPPNLIALFSRYGLIQISIRCIPNQLIKTKVKQTNR